MPAAENDNRKHAPHTVRVWDVPTRLFHWTLAALVTTCLVTGYLGDPSLFALHITAGTGVAALLAFRLAWGFLGPWPARFRSFLFGPRALIDHLIGLLVGRPPRHLGHNPAGSWMIFALLGTLTMLVLAGFVAIGGTEKLGPLAGIAPYWLGKAAKELHEALAVLVMLMVFGHVGGVLLESWLLRENLPASMVHGRRLIPENEPELVREAASLPRPASPALALRLPLAVAAAGAVMLLPNMPLMGAVKSDAIPAERPAFPEVYASECGDCHTPYHPALLPPESWKTILANLENHFGEDASLDAETLKTIRDWLLAEAKKPWDVKPAHELRLPGGELPLRMTETPFWKKKHQDIPASVFTSPAVGGKVNCAACHRDADTGLFRRTAIAIPKRAATSNRTN